MKILPFLVEEDLVLYQFNRCIRIQVRPGDDDAMAEVRKLQLGGISKNNTTTKIKPSHHQWNLLGNYKPTTLSM